MKQTEKWNVNIVYRWLGWRMAYISDFVYMQNGTHSHSIVCHNELYSSRAIISITKYTPPKIGTALKFAGTGWYRNQVEREKKQWVNWPAASYCTLWHNWCRVRLREIKMSVWCALCIYFVKIVSVAVKWCIRMQQIVNYWGEGI